MGECWGDTQHPGHPPAASSRAHHLLLHGVPALQAAGVGSLHAQQHLGVELQRLGLGKVAEKGHDCWDGLRSGSRRGQTLAGSAAGSVPRPNRGGQRGSGRAQPGGALNAAWGERAGVSKGCVSPAAISAGSTVAGETQGKVEKSTPRVDSGAFQETAGKIIMAGIYEVIYRAQASRGSRGAGGGAEQGQQRFAVSAPWGQRWEPTCDSLVLTFPWCQPRTGTDMGTSL